MRISRRQAATMNRGRQLPVSCRMVCLMARVRMRRISPSCRGLRPRRRGRRRATSQPPKRAARWRPGFGRRIGEHGVGRECPIGGDEHGQHSDAAGEEIEDAKDDGQAPVARALRHQVVQSPTTTDSHSSAMAALGFVAHGILDHRRAQQVEIRHRPAQ